jgi:hypothetical protein
MWGRQEPSAGSSRMSPRTAHCGSVRLSGLIDCGRFWLKEVTDTDQHEVVEPSPLLDHSGSLVQAGWARQPLLDCNLEEARTVRFGPLQRFRIKRWDYYGVTSPDGYFSITLADLGYAGTAFIYLVDFATGTFHEESVTIPFGRGLALARNSDSGRCTYSSKHVQVRFDAKQASRRLRVRWDDFDGVQLRADLQYTLPPGHESTVMATPIRGNRFYYNRKINAMPVEGTLQNGASTSIVSPDTSLGNLDWGRGVWEYASFWVWASASGFLSDGRTVGLNFGYGFGDTSAAVENTVLLGGRIHKLGDVDIDYSDSDFMRSWRMCSERVDLIFTPFLERVAATNLVLVRSKVHQLFGRYSGSVTDDAGNVVQIDNVVGWAEEHHASW